LLDAGWDVQIHEPVPTLLSGRGAGIVTHRELFEALTSVGIDAGPELGITVERRVTFDVHGDVIGSRDVEQILTSWGRLYRVAARAVP